MQRAPADPLAYQSEAARLTLTGQIDEMKFAADLTLDAVAEGEQIDGRGFTLAYTAPASLCGLTFTRRSGETILTRGAITLAEPDGRWDRMIVPAALFCIDCDLGRATVVRQNGATLNRIEVADDEGSYVLWLDETGFPGELREPSAAARSLPIFSGFAVGGRQTILIPERKFPAMGYTYSDFPNLPAHKTWAEIDLAALRRNYRTLCSFCPGQRHIAVVKADAYGHGAGRCVNALMEEGCTFFAVSSIEEAIAVRAVCSPEAGEVLILGYTLPDEAALLAQYGILQTVFSVDYAAALSRAAAKAGGAAAGSREAGYRHEPPRLLHPAGRR